jgi:hypothetical protein
MTETEIAGIASHAMRNAGRNGMVIYWGNEIASGYPPPGRGGLHPSQPQGDMWRGIIDGRSARHVQKWDWVITPSTTL